MRDGAPAAALAKAIVAELKLDVAPDRVRLLLEVAGGAPVPLDSSEKLAGQGVLEGSKVVVEVTALEAAPHAAVPRACLSRSALPLPLYFVEECVGGVPMMVANLHHSRGLVAPFFLTPAEHAALAHFVGQMPSQTPSFLMLSGTIKSGKTSVLRDIIPGLVAAHPASAARRPVFFHFAFPLNDHPDEAAAQLTAHLVRFARSLGITIAPAEDPRVLFPVLLEEFAQRVDEEGGTLWLLLDELGAPIVGSPTPAAAATFSHLLKKMVGACSPYARIVGTGSGMVSLLRSIGDTRVNGFTFWDIITHVSLGREPSGPVALAMAERIVPTFAGEWPRALTEAITPQRIVDTLALSAHGELTSPRPALVAFLASRLGNARAGEPSAALQEAVEGMLNKLREEAARDAALGLEQMEPAHRMQLRALADGRIGALAPGLRRVDDKQAALFCEEGATRLLPPYGALIRSWISGDGFCAIRSVGGGVEFAPGVRNSLRAFSECRGLVSDITRRALSLCIFDYLKRNGIGAALPGGGVRPPRTASELSAVPAILHLLAVLGKNQLFKTGGPSQSSRELAMAMRSEADSQTYMLTAGFSVLLWFRHFDAHAGSPALLRSDPPFRGLSCAIVEEVVRHAAKLLASQQSREFELDPSDGSVRLVGEAERAQLNSTRRIRKYSGLPRRRPN